MGKLLFTGELVRSWLENAELIEINLVDAGRQIAEGARERPVWSELAQSEYLEGIQAMVIAGALEIARELLLATDQFKRTQRHHEWNCKLVDLLLEQPGAAAIQEHLDPYFDLIRNPDSRTMPHEGNHDRLLGIPLLRLRLALIRWIYIERQPVAGNWRHIIGQIGY